jgi:hypothetical protein
VQVEVQGQLRRSHGLSSMVSASEPQPRPEQTILHTFIFVPYVQRGLGGLIFRAQAEVECD